MTILNQFRQTILSQSLIKKNDTVIVGTSGGCDSMALAYLLNTIKHDIGFQITLAHFNHKLRPSADTDEKTVRDFSEQLNIPVVVSSWKNPPKPDDSKIEEKARHQRQKFFANLIKKYQAQSVALAHHQDDVAETVLMKLIRGTGTTGLSGIAPDRVIDDIRYIRPLLDFSKHELITLCKNKNIAYSDDLPNTNTDFFRNKIRHNLLPLIEEEYNDRIKNVLSSNASIISAESDFLNTYCETIYRKLATQTQKSITFERKPFVRKHIALQRILVRKAFTALTGSNNQLTFAHVERVINGLSKTTKETRCPLTKGVSARISPDNIVFSVT